MQPVTCATVVATTARINPITLFASLELSKSKWLVTINSPGSEKFSKHVVEGGDSVCLLDLLSRAKAKAEQRFGLMVGTTVIQEAGLDGFWIHRLLLANGIESHVVDAASIAGDRRHRRAKTDAIDAEVIARFADKVRPQVRPMPTSDARALGELVARRRQIVEMIGMEAKSPPCD